jgi:hypothetical protein
MTSELLDVAGLFDTVFEALQETGGPMSLTALRRAVVERLPEAALYADDPRLHEAVRAAILGMLQGGRLKLTPDRRVARN